MKNKYASDFLNHPVVKRFIEKDGDTNKIIYKEFQKNGCGIERGRRLSTDVKARSTLVDLLNLIHTKSSQRIITYIDDTVLNEVLVSKQRDLVIRVIFSIDNYAMKMSDAYSMIIRILYGDCQQVMNELDALEEQFLINQIAKEDAENDSSQ